MFRQTQELSKEDEVPLLEFPDSEIRREEEEFDPMHLRTLRVHEKNCLKFLLPKGDLLGPRDDTRRREA